MPPTRGDILEKPGHTYVVSKTVINVRVVAILFINLFVHAVVTDRRHHGIVESLP